MKKIKFPLGKQYHSDPWIKAFVIKKIKEEFPTVTEIEFVDPLVVLNYQLDPGVDLAIWDYSSIILEEWNECPDPRSEAFQSSFDGKFCILDRESYNAFLFCQGRGFMSDPNSVCLLEWTEKEKELFPDLPSHEGGILYFSSEHEMWEFEEGIHGDRESFMVCYGGTYDLVEFFRDCEVI